MTKCGWCDGTGTDWSVGNTKPCLSCNGTGEKAEKKMPKFEVVQEGDKVTVYKDAEVVGQCEAYELDAICSFLGVKYLETDENGDL